MKTLIIPIIFILLSFQISALGENTSFESEEHNLTLIKLTDGLNHPWSLAILPNDEGFLITERPGVLYHFQNNKLNKIEGLPPIAAIGQGGLLDIILDGGY